MVSFVELAVHYSLSSPFIFSMNMLMGLLIPLLFTAIFKLSGKNYPPKQWNWCALCPPSTLNKQKAQMSSENIWKQFASAEWPAKAFDLFHPKDVSLVFLHLSVSPLCVSYIHISFPATSLTLLCTASPKKGEGSHTPSSTTSTCLIYNFM